jgi:hypothetical protein
MAVQPPFRSDAFQVENADAPVGPRLIEADLLDGSMRFTDPRVPAGIDLHALAGLQQAHNTIVVSQTGIAASKDSNGDPITTVQGGLDAVPSSADVNSPWLVLLAPGLYIEDIYFLRDGVTLRGLGNVTLREASGLGTVRMRAGATSTPRRVRLQDLRIENTTVGQACVDISSATFAVGTLTIAVVPNIGDIAEVGGVNLSAIANGSVPAPGEFELGLTTAATATNLAAAINDPVNGLTGTVVATVVGSVVTIRALNDGPAGNAITISSTVPLIIVPSGATLTGGATGAPGSVVGDNLIEIIDCDLVATGLAGYQLRASAVNRISVRGGDWRESSTGTFFDVFDCAYCSLVDQPYAKRVVLNYDNTNPNLPVIGTSTYELQNVNASLFDLTAGFVGVGSVTLTDCTFLGATLYSGDAPARSFTATRCRFGSMTMGGVAPAMVLSNCTRGTLVGAGTGTLAETTLQGSALFAGVPLVTVLFSEPQPDLLYRVLLEPVGPPLAILDIPFIPAPGKTVTSFDIAFGAPQALTVEYVVKRDI